MSHTPVPCSRLAALLVILCAGLAAAWAPAQCSTQWRYGNELPGTDGNVTAVGTWDPDGAGPAAARVVASGLFQYAGSLEVSNRLVAWDPATGEWSRIGLYGGGASVLKGMPNGDLAAGFVDEVKLWNGSIWTGIGPSGSIAALAVLPNGDLIAAGNLSFGGAPTYRVARWNGVSWSPLGGSFDGILRAVAVLPNGDVVAGGSFTSAAGVATRDIARWDGTSWSSLGTSSYVPLGVYALAVLPNGDLVAGGNNYIFGPPEIFGYTAARWNGSTWALMGGLGPRIYSLAVLPNGDLVAGGQFSTGGSTSPQDSIARWNGSLWLPLGTGVNNSTVSSVAVLPNGHVVAGGTFATAGSVRAERIARWDGAAWSSLGLGINGVVEDLVRLPDGDLLAAGAFTTAGNVAAQNIARYDGTTWSAFAGAGDVVSSVTAVGVHAGDVVAGGLFAPAGGGPAVDRVERWSGGAWSGLGSSFNNRVEVLHARANGDLVAAGQFSSVGGTAANRIASWDGSAWLPLGSGLNATPYAIASLPNGDLVIGGSFTTAGGVTANRVARWDGSAWSALGTGMNGQVLALALLPNGDLVAAGAFTTAGGVAAARIARWNGTTWSPLGGGTNATVYSLFVLPDGDLLVGGAFYIAGVNPADQLARWDGVAWTAFPGGSVAGEVRALALQADGQLAVGGTFLTVAGLKSAYLARLATTCPPSAAASGLGCPSSGGSNTLTAATLPWVDATFHADGSGLPTLAFVAVLTSFTAVPQGALPLASVFAQGVPGCDVLVAPDILDLLVTTTGTAQSTLFLPNTPPLVGLTFFHQMVPIELDAQGNVVAITATNALSLTAGTF